MVCGIVSGDDMGADWCLCLVKLVKRVFEFRIDKIFDKMEEIERCSCPEFDVAGGGVIGNFGLLFLAVSEANTPGALAAIKNNDRKIA